MGLGRVKQLKQKIIAIGRKLQNRHLAVANSGNLSARLDKDNILITATATSLGQLEPKDIIRINIFAKHYYFFTIFFLHNRNYQQRK